MTLTKDQRLMVKTALVTSLVLMVLTVGFKVLTRASSPGLQIPPVVIQQPKLLPIVDYVTQTGTVVAFNSVDLMARIEGYLESIEFIDGTIVDKGKELFVVEPKPYLEKLKAAEAMVLVQKASYQYAKAEYERQKRMYKQNATSLNNVEKWAAKTAVSDAEIAKAIADAEVARINYSYTHVISPFKGRIGRHLVDTGNLVGDGKATDIATIQQISPIYVYFNLNELDFIKIREAARARALKPSEMNTISVGVRLQNETTFLHEGKLNFVNTGLNASTGTMEIRALLQNKDFALLPGLFVQVRVPLSKPIPRLTIPDLAILYDQIGSYVLTIDGDNRVVQKRVELGSVDNGVRVVTKGLVSNDKVVVSGIQNAIPGHLVAPRGQT